jgi:hypothetical protein
MYAIYIANPSAFAASTRCNALFDTQLFLFDANGNPVSFNDDAPEGGLASRLDGSCIPGPGLYYLAVSAYDRDAADCNGAELWADTPYSAIRCADGTGSGRVGGWTGSHSVNTTYIITLGGARKARRLATPTTVHPRLMTAGMSKPTAAATQAMCPQTRRRSTALTRPRASRP